MKTECFKSEIIDLLESDPTGRSANLHVKREAQNGLTKSEAKEALYLVWEEYGSISSPTLEDERREESLMELLGLVAGNGCANHYSPWPVS